MSEDEGTDLMELSVEVIKNQRTNEERKQARVISKIITLCDDKSSRRAVEELRKELVLSQEELTQQNAVLETKLPEEDVGRYQRELDERVTACFKRIDEYAQLGAIKSRQRLYKGIFEIFGSFEKELARGYEEA